MSASLLSQPVLRHKELALALARSFPEAHEEMLTDTPEGVKYLQTTGRESDHRDELAAPLLAHLCLGVSSSSAEFEEQARCF
jgi:hypothetical protein